MDTKIVLLVGKVPLYLLYDIYNVRMSYILYYIKIGKLRPRKKVVLKYKCFNFYNSIVCS